MAESGPVRERHESTHGVPWKRLVVWALVFGVVTNVVVAVGAAFMFPNGVGLRSEDDRHWTVGESPGWARYEFSTHEALEEGPELVAHQFVQDCRELAYEKDQGQYRVNYINFPEESHYFVIECWGWPCRTIWGWKYDGMSRPMGSISAATTSAGGGDLLPILFPSQAGPARRILPFYPLWSGLLANVAIFSAMWLLLFRGVRVWKRVLRVRKGVCVACRYDLRGSVSGMCPECGDGQAGVWG